MKEYADRLQLQLQRVKDVSKVELIGLQDQKYGLRFLTLKRCSSGFQLQRFKKPYKSKIVWQVLAFETGTDRIQIRVSGHLQNIDEIKNTFIGR